MVVSAHTVHLAVVLWGTRPLGREMVKTSREEVEYLNLGWLGLISSISFRREGNRATKAPSSQGHTLVVNRFVTLHVLAIPGICWCPMRCLSLVYSRPQREGRVAWVGGSAFPSVFHISRQVFQSMLCHKCNKSTCLSSFTFFPDTAAIFGQHLLFIPSPILIKQ